MKIRNNTALGVLFCALLVFLYIFLSYRPLGTELQLTPEWTIDISKAPVRAAKPDERLPFRLGKNAGYFTHSGEIDSIYPIASKCTISGEFYSIYDTECRGAVIYKNSGERFCTLETSGFPFIQDDRIYLFLPGGSSFAVCNNYGSIKNRYERSCPITAFNSSKAGIVAGFSDGTLCTFKSDGELDMTLSPGGSDYPVILGAAISESGNLFACISGQEKQRFVLFQKEGNHAKIIYHNFFDKELLRQTYVKFSRKENMVYFNDALGVGIIDCVNFSKTHIPLEGKVIEIEESPVSDSVYILSRKNNIYTVTILEHFNSKIGEFSFNAESAFILADGNTLYIGRDQKISRITLSRE